MLWNRSGCGSYCDAKQVKLMSSHGPGCCCNANFIHCLSQQLQYLKVSLTALGYHIMLTPCATVHACPIDLPCHTSQVTPREISDAMLYRIMLNPRNHDPCHIPSYPTCLHNGQSSARLSDLGDSSYLRGALLTRLGI